MTKEIDIKTLKIMFIGIIVGILLSIGTLAVLCLSSQENEQYDNELVVLKIKVTNLDNCSHDVEIFEVLADSGMVMNKGHHNITSQNYTYMSWLIAGSKDVLSYHNYTIYILIDDRDYAFFNYYKGTELISLIDNGGLNVSIKNNEINGMTNMDNLKPITSGISYARPI